MPPLTTTTRRAAQTIAPAMHPILTNPTVPHGSLSNTYGKPPPARAHSRQKSKCTFQKSKIQKSNSRALSAKVKVHFSKIQNPKVSFLTGTKKPNFPSPLPEVNFLPTPDRSIQCPNSVTGSIDLKRNKSPTPAPCLGHIF